MKRNIAKIQLGSDYTRKNGDCTSDNNLAKFLKEHPQAELYYGDLRKDRTQYKTVYKLYKYEYMQKYMNNSYSKLIATYVER